MPPRLATWILAALIGPGEWRETVLGDLHEEYLSRAASGRRFTRTAAAGWYCAQVAAIGARYGAARLRARRRATAHTDTRRGDSLMRTLALDIRYALRGIVKRPALSALVIITLALGLGANAVIFEVADALILRPISIRDMDRLAMIAETGADVEGSTKESVSPANFLDWKREATVFDRMAALDWWPVNLAGGSEPERVDGLLVTEDFFDVLAVQAALGRTFTTDEFKAGRTNRVVISYALWQRRFGSDPGVIGRAVQVDARPYELVGVLPRGFEFPQGTDLWAPAALDPATAKRGARNLTTIARLGPGRTLDEGKAEMAVIASRLERQYPEANKDHGARVVTLVAGIRDQGVGPILALWQASAVFVLLIACANIANLLLTRGAERRRELAVRLALGASRWRLIREQLIESVVMAVASIPLALALAWIGVRLIRVSMPPRLIRFVDGWQSLDVDARLIVFTGLLAVATAALFGILPALHASRSHLTDALKDGGRGSTTGRSRQRLRRALVVAEIALALPLLVASGLGTIGARRFIDGTQGYNPDGLLTMRVGLPDARYANPETRRRFTADTIERLARLPGVSGAAAMNVLPAGGNNVTRVIEVDGRPNQDPANPPYVDYRAVTPEYFPTMQLRIVKGRVFTRADRADSLPVAIVSESLAAKYFPGEDPLARRITLGSSPRITVTIVGVSADHIHDWFDRRNYPTVFCPYDQSPSADVAFAVRGNNPSALATPALAAVRAVDPEQPAFNVLPMRELLHDKTIGLRFVAAIMTVFGALALVLAVVGVYSLMAYVVTQRTHEIGLRMALGASRRDVMALALGQTATLTAIGTIVGLAFATALGKLMEAGLLGVISSDIRLSLGLAAVLTAAALAAGYVPARRATSIDPMVALRAE